MFCINSGLITKYKSDTCSPNSGVQTTCKPPIPINREKPGYLDLLIKCRQFVGKHNTNLFDKVYILEIYCQKFR